MYQKYYNFVKQATFHVLFFFLLIFKKSSGNF